MSEFSQASSQRGQDPAGAPRELVSQVYSELRKLAAFKMAREAPGQTLQPTALVHEAWLRIMKETGRTFASRTHFFNAAGEAMRRILIDRARRRQCVRHGGGQQRMDAAELELITAESDERLLEVHEALDQLAAEDPQKAEVVKLRFFVGMNDREVAEALGLSERTVERYWAYSKAWLFCRLGNRAAFGPDTKDSASEKF